MDYDALKRKYSGDVKRDWKRILVWSFLIVFGLLAMAAFGAYVYYFKVGVPALCGLTLEYHEALADNVYESSVPDPVRYINEETLDTICDFDRYEIPENSNRAFVYNMSCDEGKMDKIVEEAETYEYEDMKPLLIMSIGHATLEPRFISATLTAEKIQEKCEDPIIWSSILNTQNFFGTLGLSASDTWNMIYYCIDYGNFTDQGRKDCALSVVGAMKATGEQYADYDYEVNEIKMEYCKEVVVFNAEEIYHMINPRYSRYYYDEDLTIGERVDKAKLDIMIAFLNREQNRMAICEKISEIHLEMKEGIDGSDMNPIERFWAYSALYQLSNIYFREEVFETNEWGYVDWPVEVEEDLINNIPDQKYRDLFIEYMGY